MEQPLVSILIPIYNVEKYIKRCTISLMEQSYPNIEYVFVNDCTPDNSIDILNETIKCYPQRKNIKIINHDKNKGLAASRNTGLRYSTGIWISFVDSDDYLETNAIENLIRTAQDEQSDIVVGTFQYITNSGKEIFKRPKKVYTKIEYIQSLLRWNETDLTLWGKIIKKELFLNNNISSLEGYNFGEDFAITPRITYYANKISFLNEVVYNYEYNNTNSYTKKVSLQSIASLNYIATYITRFYMSKDDSQIFEKHLFKGLINMQIWIYSNTHNINDLQSIQALIKKENISAQYTDKIISSLLEKGHVKLVIRLNKIINKIRKCLI